MDRTAIKKILDKLNGDLQTVTDQRAVSIIKTLLNLVEILVEENSALRKDIQTLKDEINRLKGEQGKPDIRKQKNDDNAGNADHSSESDRKKRINQKNPREKKKNKNIAIDRRVTCEIDQDILPDDAEFKGYETRVFQDLKIVTENVKFSLPVYYSSSLNKTFIAKLPDGYYGTFGPGIRSIVITLYRDSGMTEPAIERFLKTFNIQISKATISRMITEGHDDFHKEKEDIINAGLKSSSYQHVDDTGCRVNGKNYYAHILCNPYFTAFFTRPKKNRLTLLEILCRGELKFAFNNDAYAIMSELGLSDLSLAELKKITEQRVMTSHELDDVLNKLFPNPKSHRASRLVIREASAIVYYQHSEYAIEHLICDDAPQFNRIAKYKSSCWIHDGRHYKKLNPIIILHRNLLDNFIEKYWDFYSKLLAYKKKPSTKKALRLSTMFDKLFSIKTGYTALDERIARTLAKKESLLLVLQFHFLPLHNNPAELGARAQARMRDVNLQTISANGTKTKDTFATIIQTARKLSVNVYNYVYDRVSKSYSMPSLAYLINEKSNLINNTT